MTDKELPQTMSIPEAGKRYFGLSRNGSYAAAERGEIPTIKVGRLLRVPFAAWSACSTRRGKKSGGREMGDLKKAKQQQSQCRACGQ